jgi:hypothetical protein
MTQTIDEIIQEIYENDLNYIDNIDCGNISFDDISHFCPSEEDLSYLNEHNDGC